MNNEYHSTENDILRNLNIPMFSKIEITIYIYFNWKFITFLTKILNNRMLDLFKNSSSYFHNYCQYFVCDYVIRSNVYSNLKDKMFLLYTISACPAGYLPRPSNSGELQCPVKSYMLPAGNNLKFDSLSLSVMNVMFFQSTNYLLVFCMINLL